MAGSRRLLLQLAREQINNAHYVFGGYGNIPGVLPGEDPYCIPTANVGRRVQLLDNDTTSRCRTVYAACTRLGEVQHSRRRSGASGSGSLQSSSSGIRVSICAGRRDVARGSHAQITEPLPPPRGDLLYPRPDHTPSGPEIWGESCVGIRHFDCIGFVAWLVWRVSGRCFRMTVRQWLGRPFGTRPIQGFRAGVPSTYTELQPGDLLGKTHGGNGDGGRDATTHIGIYTGNGRVIHARGRYLGVQETPVGVVRWTAAGRLPPAILESP